MARPEDKDLREARRRFLASCGRFALVTPPAVTLLLSSTARGYASALSGSPQGPSNYEEVQSRVSSRSIYGGRD